jgi:hypothetical protein
MDFVQIFLLPHIMKNLMSCFPGNVPLILHQLNGLWPSVQELLQPFLDFKQRMAAHSSIHFQGPHIPPLNHFKIFM